MRVGSCSAGHPTSIARGCQLGQVCRQEARRGVWEGFCCVGLGFWGVGAVSVIWWILGGSGGADAALASRSPRVVMRAVARIAMRFFKDQTFRLGMTAPPKEEGGAGLLRLVCPPRPRSYRLSA